MAVNQRGRRLLLPVVVCIALVVAGTGVVAACETCADPDREESEHEPFWSDEEFPYDTSENRSFVEIIVEETEEEMEEDFGDEYVAGGAGANATVANVSVGATAKPDGASATAEAAAGESAATLAIRVPADSG